MYWVRIVDNNYGSQETALQEGRKHLEGPSRSCKGRVKSLVCRTGQPSFDHIQAAFTTDIQDLSGYAGGAAQILQANSINDISHPNLTTNIHNSSGYTRSAAQIPQVNAIMTSFVPNQPQTSTVLQVMPEALPKFHRQIILMTSLVPI